MDDGGLKEAAAAVAPNQRATQISPLQQSSIVFKCFFCIALAGKNEIEIDTQEYVIQVCRLKWTLSYFAYIRSIQFLNKCSRAISRVKWNWIRRGWIRARSCITWRRIHFRYMLMRVHNVTAYHLAQILPFPRRRLHSRHSQQTPLDFNTSPNY